MLKPTHAIMSRPSVVEQDPDPWNAAFLQLVQNGFLKLCLEDSKSPAGLFLLSRFLDGLFSCIFQLAQRLNSSGPGQFGNCVCFLFRGKSAFLPDCVLL